MTLLKKLFRLKIITLVFAIVSALAFTFPAYGAGELDTTFTGSVFGSLNGNISAIKVQPDGKILIGGFFTDVNGFAASAIGRLNADGTTDTSFKAGDVFSGFGVGSQILSIALQPDGKILIGGQIWGVDGEFRPGIRRLNSDGSLDNSFNVVQLNTLASVYDMEIQSDGKIVIGGEFQINSIFNIARLNLDGTLDNTFSPGSSVGIIRDLDLQTDGKIIVGGANLLRVTATGQIDNTFPLVTANTIEAVKIRPDGKILIGGSFSTVNGFNQGRISLINSDGSLDLNFNLNNQGANGTINDIALKADGKILIGGAFSTFNIINRLRIAQLNSDGSLDTFFQNNTTLNLVAVYDVEFLPDGRILVGVSVQAGTTPSLTRFNSDGTNDSTFAPHITRSGRVRKILQQPDGKIVVTGEFPAANGMQRKSFARFNADGSLDTSFFPFTNNLGYNPNIGGLAIQPDGKILVGMSSGFVIKRTNVNGAEDTSFSSPIDGLVNDIAVLPNGQILVGGQFSANGTKYIARLNSNGTVDTSFGTVQPNNQVNKILVQPDGKILIGGEFTQIGASIRGRIARLNENGSLDNTFNPPGGANNSVYDLDLQTDGKIVLGGVFTAVNGNSNQNTIGRLNTDGTLDTAFIQNTNAAVNAVKVQPDGKILIGGTMSTVGGTAHNGIARLNSNGTVDTSFNTFANSSVWDINLQDDGKILLGGTFTKIDRLSAVRIARLLNTNAPPKTLFDYDGDGRADVSVFRPSENKWFIYRSSDNQITQQIFAVAGDIPTPADFDGDGKTDMAIFRPSSGQWWYLSTLDGQQKSAQWGANGDIPRPADFDGDGKADFIVFRPSDNNWYRLGSSGGFSVVNFGTAGDKPVIGDFDGDGKSDVAIYRPSTGDWWWQSSVDNVQRATRWGIASDIPAPADYDGDGRTDFAVYRPSTGVWYIVNSSNGTYTIAPFGLSEDKPIPADFDGDGRADIAVFRPSSGIWYQQRTTAGFTAQQFGVSSDVPTPNAFVP